MISLTAAASHWIAFHSLGTGASVGPGEIGAESRAAARAPRALINIRALVPGIALVALGALAPVIARQIYAESPSSAGSLVIALVHVDTLRGRRWKIVIYPLPLMLPPAALAGGQLKCFCDLGS